MGIATIARRPLCHYCSGWARLEPTGTLLLRRRNASTKPPPRNVTVLGAGITGLVASYRLAQQFPTTRITLLEASPRIGGWMESGKKPIGFKTDDGVVEGEVVVESGPRSLRPRGSRGSAATLKLIRDLDLVNDLIPIANDHPAARNRFLLDTNSSTLTALPSSLLALLSKQPPLLRSILPSVLSEPFRSRPPSNVRDESIDSLVRRRLGGQVADNLVSGMIHGIYAADSRQLSVRSGMGLLWDAEDRRGSILGGMFLGTKSAKQKGEEAAEWAELGVLGKEREKWSLYGMKGGLGTFGSTLQQRVIKSRVDIRLNEGVEKIEPVSEEEGGGVRITTSQGTTTADHVISALSPYHLSKTLPADSPLPHLTHNPSTSVGVVSVVYAGSPTSIHPDGFGYLIPRSGAHRNPEGILGVVFDSTAVPGLDGALEGKITKLTVMMGGPYWSSPDYSLPDNGSPLPRPTDPSELLDSALSHLHRVFPILADKEPLLAIPRLQPDCIPTYLPYHGQRLRQIHQAVESGPWKGKLSLVGNGYGGVGVNDCIYSAEEVVAGMKKGHVGTGLERWADWQ